MRLLSIFALLFLISLLLHGGLKDRDSPVELAAPTTPAAPTIPAAPTALDGQAKQDTGEVANAEPVQPEQEDFSSFIFSQPYPVKHFDFEREYVFSIIEMEIKNLIIGRNDDSFKAKNHFCAVGYEFPPHQQGKKKGSVKKEVVVYWGEAKMLYRWTGGDPKAAGQGFYNASSLMFSRSIPLDPNQGAVGEGTPGNGFGDYKDRAEKVVADCEKHGKTYEIEPFIPPPKGFERPKGGGRPHPPPATPPTPMTPTSSPLVHIFPGRFAGGALTPAVGRSSRSSTRAAMNMAMPAVIAMLEP